MTDASIHPIQLDLLNRFGKWMQLNGEGIYETLPWIRAEGTTTKHQSVRFTKKDYDLFAINTTVTFLHDFQSLQCTALKSS